MKVTGMDAILRKVIQQSLQVTLLVFFMMILVDIVNVRTRGRLAAILNKGKQSRQYVVASLLGAAPGCVGAFTNVSLYVHGMISFGALVGASRPSIWFLGLVLDCCCMWWDGRPLPCI